ncbi:cation diffusion facilitator family transporter [Crocosphaera sp. UHCC 0190]|uniref:cation diffusion facilitator family transporter n=1 Tax=Crocosphaera sp. UHCC 0190 TaxID=3110246 RepID=UPI002B21A221|nr:cation diffusion facilitator family transporter [Crocosphaera sp. UHCC 0190]MEA5508743.1 cation diffusion facilitator family transporter [Crocosphaera sp. UHCC 0190]
MTHSHSHDHHHHHHPVSNYTRAFLIGTLLNVGFVAIEFSFGFWTQSLSLLADAGHNLSDVFGLLLAWSGNFLSQYPPTQRYTYGLRRSSILAALLNALVLLLVMGGIAWEAVQRIFSPSPIPGITIMIVALVGVIINTITALLFMSGRNQDLNIRGAFLHMAADAVVSFGVILTGLAILLTGWLWFDPVVSLIIVAVIVVGTWQLLKDSVNLALDAVPVAIEPKAVRTYLTELPGVTQIHDLHIWAMSTRETALTVHLVMPNGFPGDAFLTETCHQLHDLFGIEHPTLQIETGDPNYPCNLAPDHRV